MVIAQIALRYDKAVLRSFDFRTVLADSVHSDMVDGNFVLLKRLAQIIEYTEEVQRPGDQCYEAATALRRYYYEELPFVDHLTMLSFNLLNYSPERQLNLFTDLLRHLICCTRPDLWLPERVCYLSPEQYNTELERLDGGAEHSDGFLD